MADAIVLKVLEQLASILIQEVEQEVRLVVGVDEEVQKLTDQLETIRAVLADANIKQWTNAAIKHWLDKLKDISHDIDDVLDEWNSAILKSRIEAEHGSSTASSKPPGRKVRWLNWASCFCIKEFGRRRDIAAKIKKLNERLDVVAKEKNDYSLASTNETEVVEHVVTTSFVNIAEVKGREWEKKWIIDRLLSEGSNTPNPRIISIWGMGGIGKTTLAKLAYNDTEVQSHFKHKIWVCVSNPFDETRIVKEILEALLGKSPKLSAMQNLMQQLHDNIKDKKILLVLDDVWEEDPKRSEQLRTAIKSGAPESKVLVTTRKEKVASIMGCTESDKLRLGQVSDDECWSIFSQVAFSGATVEPELEVIGRKIVEKCKGLPLAAKTMGGLLRFKRPLRDWKDILESEMWKLKDDEVERDLFVPLLLSYYDLPPPMRQCFLYCAIFPKDTNIRKDELIQLWMAQGYTEMMGEDYFQNMCARSLFQDFDKDHFDGNIVGCKMHDIVHEFAQFLAKSDCRNIVINGTEEQIFEPPVRHSSILLKDNEDIPPSAAINATFHRLTKLRSLCVRRPQQEAEKSFDSRILCSLFDTSTLLRWLDLQHCGIEDIPSTVSRLVHLRHLNLSGNSKLKELPTTVYDLCNLQTLNISWCDSLAQLPPGIERLINLRQLINKGVRYSHAMLPKGIGRLTSLRTLILIDVEGEHEYDGKAAAAASLEDLKELEHLSGSLNIRGLGNSRDIEGARQAQLKERRDIASLWFDFKELKNENEEEGRKSGDEKVLEALEPPPELHNLEISLYISIKLPEWFTTSLNHLKTLEVRNCKNIDYLPPLGRLQSLEYLELRDLPNVKKVGIEFLGLEQIPSSLDINPFPKLKALYVRYLPNWKEWEYGEHFPTVMPEITKVSLRDCPKLEMLPVSITKSNTLKYLVIRECGILESGYDQGRFRISDGVTVRCRAFGYVQRARRRLYRGLAPRRYHYTKQKEEQRGIVESPLIFTSETVSHDSSREVHLEFRHFTEVGLL